MEILSFSSAQLGSLVGSFLWPLTRIMAFLSVVPVFGTQLVPARIRIVLSLTIAILVAPLLPPMPEVEGISPAAVVIIIQQIFIGVALGFFMQLIFHTFVIAGQLIAMQMGLGFASMMDPTNGVSVPVVSSMYLMVVTLLFITMNGHLLMLKLIVDSFTTFPVSTSFDILDSGLLQIINGISWIFSSALIIALPAITALLITNFAFGVMTKAAPQLNIFALGFPVAMILGMFILWLTMDSYIESAKRIFTDMFLILETLIAR
ncbi:MAG: flagellar biosynthetic protein FliR [SAR86 cluster bacterium]|uniref:Flagellar biosynthetic protein FliR n=1 Tax=SAR86 cluster bacterium TaxID=2030880 RepID=A0A2A4MIR1_9GAMM|nr:MAG: flagellar biosynthetic protein FliR [SAR86 cluster bacterium]